ncbi:MAG: hypothetical protein Q9169_006772 [Polycauliona sp. 2 TL-2023]
MVVERCDRETLFSWSTANKFYHNVAADIIWNSLCIKDLRLGRTWYNIHNLTIKSQQSKSRAQRVKNLDFFHDPSISDSLMRRLSNTCMTYALQNMPNLERVWLEGDVHPEGFDHLAQRQKIQQLSIRLGHVCLPLERDALPEPRCTYTLDFVPLAGTVSLQDLSIGRLTPREAPSLAQAIQNSLLIKLRVIAAPPVDSGDPRQIYAGTKLDNSPIQIILENSSVKQGHVWAGFPQSLQFLSLQDTYRPIKLMREDLLLKALGSLSVSKLQLYVRATKQMAHFFHYAYLPQLISIAVNACRHFLPEEAWTILGLELYQSIPIARPDKPIYRTLMEFLARHRGSLEHLVLFHGLLLSGTYNTPVLYFDRDNLKSLGIVDGRFTAGKHETPGGLDFENMTLNQEVWDTCGWEICCSPPQQINNPTHSCSCLCTEMEACITMGFIEAQTAQDSYGEGNNQPRKYEYESSESEDSDIWEVHDEHGASWHVG